MRLTRNAVSPRARRAGQRPGQASAGEGLWGALNGTAALGAGRMGQGAALTSVWIRAYGRAVQLPAIPGGLAVVRVRPANGREGGPARTTAHGHPDPRMRDAYNGAAADSGQRTGQGKQQTLPRWRVCNAASRASSARCRVTPCGFATVPRALPAIRYGLARATLRNAGPGLHSRATHAHSRPSGTVSRAPKPLDPAPGKVTARPAHTRRQPAHAPPVARLLGAASPTGPTTPQASAPTSCGDARPSAPCAAPRG